jgi:Fe2+ transport system protein FeoA
MIPLELLRRDEMAEIADVGGDPRWVARMSDIGLRVGAVLRMLQPGSPCLCEVGPTRLSVRLDKAVQVLVRPVAA